MYESYKNSCRIVTLELKTPSQTYAEREATQNVKREAVTLEELQEELDSLPSQDPQFLIGWLMAQVIYLKEKENEKAKRSELEMASSFKT